MTSKWQMIQGQGEVESMEMEPDLSKKWAAHQLITIYSRLKIIQELQKMLVSKTWRIICQKNVQY